jgi:signal transduction histidine kinase
VRVAADEPLPPLGAATEVAAYRIAVEAIANAARHAHAHTCAVLLSGDRDLRIEVRDDGVGIAPATRPGVGLTAMHERATELGGRCTVSAVAPVGTRALAVLPLEEPCPPIP